METDIHSRGADKNYFSEPGRFVNFPPPETRAREIILDKLPSRLFAGLPLSVIRRALAVVDAATIHISVLVRRFHVLRQTIARTTSHSRGTPE